MCDICRMAQATYTTTWNGSPRQLSSLKKGYETRKGRPSLTKSLQSLAIDNHRIMKARLPQQTHKSIMSESFIIMDTEMIHGVGHWAREWSHVRHVFCIRFHLGKVTELNWDHDYITNHSMQALRDEFRNFCMDIDYIWFYARSRCDQIRIVDYLFEGGAVNANMEWMDAQVLIAMKMFSTDPLNPLPYVQSMSLASVDEAFIFQEEEPMFVEIDVGIPEQEREKVHKDVVNLGNLLNLARFVITE